MRRGVRLGEAGGINRRLEWVSQHLRCRMLPRRVFFGYSFGSFIGVTTFSEVSPRIDFIRDYDPLPMRCRRAMRARAASGIDQLATDGVHRFDDLVEVLR